MTTAQAPPAKKVQPKPSPATDKKPENLAAAMAQLQTQLPKIGKGQTADAGTYTYKYADLASISEQIMPLLGNLGLSFITMPTYRGDRFVLAYSLLHESGDKVEGEYPLPSGNPQAIGSAISYGRRYVLCAVTGVAPEEGDDDGRAAAEHHRENPPATQPQLKAMHAAFGDLGITDRAQGLTFIADTVGHDVGSSKDLSRAEASQVIDRLKATLDAAVKADAVAKAEESSTDEQPADTASVAAEDDKPAEQPALPADGEEAGEK